MTVRKDGKDRELETSVNLYRKGKLSRRDFMRRAMAAGVTAGMAGALDLIGFDLQGRHHRGKDDAVNIARILAHLLQKLREHR